MVAFAQDAEKPRADLVCARGFLLTRRAEEGGSAEDMEDFIKKNKCNEVWKS